MEVVVAVREGDVGGARAILEESDSSVAPGHSSRKGFEEGEERRRGPSLVFRRGEHVPDGELDAAFFVLHGVAPG